MTPINLAAKLSTFTSHWSPRIVGSRNGKDLKVVQVRDGFVGHDHPDTDAAFMMRASSQAPNSFEGICKTLRRVLART